MSQHQPDSKFTNLHPSRKLPGLTSNQPNSFDPKSGLLAVRSMILAKLLPQVRVEAIRWRDYLMASDFLAAPHWESHWLLIPETQEWSAQDWWEKQKDLRSRQEWQSLLSNELMLVPSGNGPELDRWLVENCKWRVFPDGWVGDLFYQEGRLMCDQEVPLRQVEVIRGGGTTRVEEARGNTAWFRDQVIALMPGAAVYRDWKGETVQKLVGMWQSWLDLEQIWIGFSSDSMGDRMVLLQGTSEQLLEANRRVVLSQRANGLEIGVQVNAWFERLTEIQAALLIPGALQGGKLLRLL